MSKIQEACAAIEEAAGCLANGPDCHPYTEAWRDLNAAVRAGFLAVLEEATTAVGFDAGIMSAGGKVTEENSRGWALRSRIEELGK